MNLEYFHPVFVHFPVALTLCGTGLLAFGALRGHAGARRAGLLVLILGGVLVIPTYITGQVARAVLEDVSAFERDLPLLDTHEDMGLASLGLLLALGIVAGIALAKGGTTREDEEAKPWVLLLLALAASLLIAVTAFYGGRLVFEHGIGVRIEREAGREQPSLRGGRRPTRQSRRGKQDKADRHVPLRGPCDDRGRVLLLPAPRPIFPTPNSELRILSSSP